MNIFDGSEKYSSGYFAGRTSLGFFFSFVLGEVTEAFSAELRNMTGKK